MRIETDDGVGLTVERTGHGAPLLLVHGFGGAKEDFSDHLAALGAHATVAVFDHRGHGASDHPPDEAAYSLDRLTADTLCVADALGWPRFRLLGHSMGGMVARRLVLAHPERVDALVLMDTSPGPPHGIDPVLVDGAVEVVHTQGMDALKQLFDELDPLTTPAFDRLVAERPGYREFCDRKWAAQSPAMWVALSTELVRQPDQLAALRAVTCPTLVLVGEQDQAFLAVSYEMAEVLPDAELVVVPDAGHSPQFENPGLWFAAVDRFARANPARRERRRRGAPGAATLRAHDVDTVFTLNGGHLWPLYYGCADAGIRLVDTRHEQTAAFAAEGWAKVTRRVGVTALTAGPGVTNGISAITTAWLNGSPVTVIGGRAPHGRWGTGSLQELDHVPIVASVTKRARTAAEPGLVALEFDKALRAAQTPHRGPTFVDVPLDAWGSTDKPLPAPPDPERLRGPAPDAGRISAVARRVGRARRPVLMVGADVYWAHAEEAVAAFATATRVPVFANDLARGLLPADHELAFSRARPLAFEQADVVLVAGTPLDFRVGFGSFGDAAVVHLADSLEGLATRVPLAASCAGDLRRLFAALAEQAPSAGDTAARARATTGSRRSATTRRLAAPPTGHA